MKIPFIEDEKNEFKESLTQVDKGLKSLTAMLNRNGEGNVYFGIRDDGEIVGLKNIGKNTLQDIRQRVRDFIFPQVVINTRVLTTSEGIKYINLSAVGSEIPYSYDGRYYIRSGSSDEQLTPQMLRKLLETGDTDLIKNTESYVQELTFVGFFKFVSAAGQHPVNDKRYYNSKGFYTKEGKFNLLSFLLSDQSNVSIKVVRFNGLDKSKMSNRTEYGNKNLLRAMQDVLDYFKAVNVTKVDLSEGRRIEIPLFDYESFREAWINACLHNHWIDMIPPSIFVYDNRIEVLSYGDLPFGLSLDDFYSGLSKPVNRTLKDIFVSLRYSEQSGHGVPIVVDKYGKEAFEFSSNTVKVTIPLAFEPDWAKKRKTKEELASNLNKNQSNVLQYLKKHPEARQAQIAEELGLSIQGVKKIFAKLQELELISREGGKKEGSWIVNV